MQLLPIQSLPIQLPYDRLTEFCQHWKITEMSLFGSILRDDFRSDSDVDFLVAFAANSRWSLLDLVKMEYELEDIVDRKVDLVMKKSIEQSHNWIRRKEILETAKVIYVSG